VVIGPGDGMMAMPVKASKKQCNYFVCSSSRPSISLNMWCCVTEQTNNPHQSTNPGLRLSTRITRRG
jgi:hypothetical protein